LLRNSFRPSQEIRTMRTYWRQRNDLVQSAGRHVQRMQKALTQMNIQLANVLSDVSGVTGQAIIKAILGGQRDPHKLAEFRNPRVRASEEEIARSLEGHWQEDLLFVLQQEQDGYEFCQKQWPSAIGSSTTISSRERIGVRVPLCQKKSARDDARKRAGISRKSTCEPGCFA
jgi:transposase